MSSNKVVFMLLNQEKINQKLECEIVKDGYKSVFSRNLNSGVNN